MSNFASSSDDVTLEHTSHGKTEVRLARVKRRESGLHSFVELNVTIRLFGGSEGSFTHGDNSRVVATDTCRNQVYLHAKRLPFSTPDLFAVTLAQHFLDTYDHVEQVQIEAAERPWRRFDRDGSKHDHGFIVKEAGYRAARVKADRTAVHHVSKLRGVDVLKTTQSGFKGFMKDKATTLPETKERILATTIDAEWEYFANDFRTLKELNFELIHHDVRDALLTTFFGPVQGGVYSPSLQFTLKQMGGTALQRCPAAQSITISLPNLHFLPCTLSVMERNGYFFNDDIYIPSSQPHGIIKATLRRRNAKL